MNIAIIGYATEGQVSYEYFKKQGHKITICDQNESIELPPQAASQLGEKYLDNLDRFDRVVRTAGLSPRIIIEKNPGIEDKITTAIDTFIANCPTKNIIGITGTKGKGTTSTLTTNMIEVSGKHVFLGGNIGRSPLEFIGDIQPDNWVVLELSSFQLCDLKHSPHIAVCLMVVPEHLNWHTDMDDYIAAKSNLFARQTASDIAIYYAKNETSRQIASTGEGQKIPYYEMPGAIAENDTITIDGQAICKTSELKLLGGHNWQNACAAVTAVWQAGIRDTDAIKSVLTSFSGLEHRLEFVREVDGVRYYDDSFGTTPETAVVAIRAFEGPKVVILGGSDKGVPYDELATAVKTGNIRHALLIGDQAARIQAALETAGFHEFSAGGGTMDEIVKNARGIAKPGDTVLLSTGCASFGLFKDYKDRARQFVKAVRSLAS